MDRHLAARGAQGLTFRTTVGRPLPAPCSLPASVHDTCVQAVTSAPRVLETPHKNAKAARKWDSVPFCSLCDLASLAEHIQVFIASESAFPLLL